MPGSWITEQQVEIYMKARTKAQKQVTAAAKAGISERSGWNIELGSRTGPRVKVMWLFVHDKNFMAGIPCSDRQINLF